MQDAERKGLNIRHSKARDTFSDFSDQIQIGKLHEVSFQRARLEYFLF